MALGETLKRAREAMGLTASEVAAGTNMKTQLVQELEAEDFSRLVAPIYGRGFIKLYAEYVRLDPDPLIAEYMAIVTADKKAPAPSLKTSGKTRRVRAQVSQEAVDSHYGPEESQVVLEDESGSEPDLFTTARRKLLGRRPASEPDVSEPAAEVSRGPSLVERVRGMLATAQAWAVAQWAGIREKISWPAFRLDAPVKWVAAAIAVLLALFLVVLVIQLITSSGGRGTELIQVVLPEPFVE